MYVFAYYVIALIGSLSKWESYSTFSSQNRLQTVVSAHERCQLYCFPGLIPDICSNILTKLLMYLQFNATQFSCFTSSLAVILDWHQDQFMPSLEFLKAQCLAVRSTCLAILCSLPSQSCTTHLCVMVAVELHCSEQRRQEKKDQ